MMRSVWLWGALFALALAATAVLAVSLKARRRAAATVRGPVAPPDAGVACSVPAATPVRALAGAEGPPVLIWGVGDVRVFVDGAPTFSAPDAPKHLAVGEHAVRVEAAGGATLQTRIRVEPFTPVLLHALRADDVGLTLVRLGCGCASCVPALKPVTLDVVKAQASPADLLQEAARALQKDDWRTAAEALRGVPLRARASEAFHRLAAAVDVAGYQPDKARDELALIPSAASHDLGKLLGALESLEKAEPKRRLEVALARWNKVTEHFQALIARFGDQVPTHGISQRLGALSAAFDLARRKNDPFEQEKLLGAAEESLLEAVVQIRSAHPDDCSFQASVVSTVLR